MESDKKTIHNTQYGKVRCCANCKFSEDTGNIVEIDDESVKTLDCDVLFETIVEPDYGCNEHQFKNK